MDRFACDIEVLLAAEPIAGTSTIPANLLGTLGYSFERRQDSKPLSDEPQSVEIRSFCRVIKSRFTPNQSRRCAYDIVPGQGVIFNETYPGDGAVLLFHENAKQRELWETFLTRDLPLQFPALRYSLFDRPALQRTFATQRRFNQLHQKTDMYLACFDTYWVNWYWQLGRRSHIRELFQSEFLNADLPTTAERQANGSDKEKEKQTREKARQRWSRLLCGLDQFVRDEMKAMTEPGVAEISDSKFTEKTTDAICRAWFDAQNGKIKPQEVLKRVVVPSCRDLASGSVGLLQPLRRGDLRLFGERRSEIIEELRQQGNGVHLPRFADDRRDFYLTVPYNANASFLVCRQDLLLGKREELNKRQKLCDKSRQDLDKAQRAALQTFELRQLRHYQDVRKGRDEWQYMYDERDILRDRRVAMAQQANEETRRLAVTPQSEKAVLTWEDLILLCTDGKYECDNDGTKGTSGTSSKATAHLVLETQTLDSFLCAFLEVFWGCGGELHITPQYEIENAILTEQKLFHAFFLMRELFRLGVVERYSSVDPKKFVERFNGVKEDQWLFARHWYSTFVDVLTDRAHGMTGNYTWTPRREVGLTIQPLPHSRSAATLGGRELGPVSCWGEWHFAVLNGTENQALAADLINHLMGSNAICERAARCAAVPTVEEFYTRYASSPCIRLPERTDVPVPRLTYQELRDRIFRVAKSRRSIFDYRHCMREIHSVLTVVQHAPNLSVQDLAQQVLDAVDRIHHLQSQEMMSH